MASAYYNVHLMYRQAVKQTPFCRSSAFMHTRHAKADGIEGTLILFPSVQHLPQLELREEANEAGVPMTVGRVRIYDVLLRVIWDGEFNFTSGAWRSWRINRWRNGKGCGNLLGSEKCGELTRDMPVAWLTHDGRGATVTYARDSLSHIGYNGVDADGRLRYVYMTRDSVLKEQHMRYEPTLPVGTPLTPCWIVADVSNAARHRRLEWGYGGMDAVLDNDASPLHCFDVSLPSALPHFSAGAAAAKRQRHNDHSPMKEAFWLAHYVEGYEKMGKVGPRTAHNAFVLCDQYRHALICGYKPTSLYMTRLGEKLRLLANDLPAKTLDNILGTFGPESSKHTPALLHLFDRDLTGLAHAERTVTAPPKHIKLEDTPFPYNLNPDTGFAWIDPEYSDHPDYMAVYTRINEHHNRGT